MPIVIKYFVVFAPVMDAAQEGAFVLNLSGMEWWHHLPGCWLIKDPKGLLDAETIKNYLVGAKVNVHCGVFKVDPTGNWATVLPTVTSPRSKEWILNHWVPRRDE